MVRKVRVVSQFSEVNQGHLALAVQELFGGENILHNVRKEGGLKNSNKFWEIDVWIPALNLYFEFQDGHHYTTTWYVSLHHDAYREYDISKSEAVRLRGGTFIEVPCWWDGKNDSLIATIKFQRPDLLSENVAEILSITLNPERGFFPKTTGVPDIGQLMRAGFPEASRVKFNFFTFSNEHKWWMGEKYDGIRFCWNPARSSIYTRSGAPLPLPSYLTSPLPHSYLEGEIWFGRGTFTHSQTLLSPDPTGKIWDSLRYIVFDNPSPHLNDSPFENRYASLLSIISPHSTLTILVPRLLCINSTFLTDQVQNIIDEGGEGIILRKVGSPYVHGLSPFLLKIKAGRGDGEALVVSVDTNTYLLKLPDGLTFRVAKSKVETERKLKKGEIVSFFFDNYTRSMIPMNPVIYKIRTDVSWRDVVSNFVSKNPQKQQLNVHSSLPLGKSQQDNIQRRNFFINLARKRNFDPLIASNWYSFNFDSLNKKGEGKTKFGNFVNSLKRAFPELNIQEKKFGRLPRNYFMATENRRHLLDNVAKAKGLDPLLASTWYSLSQDRVAKQQGGRAVLYYKKGGYYKTLSHLYPDIDFELEKFRKYPKSYWEDRENRKHFFTEFAHRNGFDPLIAEHWYAISNSDFLQTKRAPSVIRHHGSYRKALLDFFPNIGLDVHKLFAHYTPTYLEDKNNARNLFIRFANKKGFDPLVPENWYKTSREEVVSSQKGAKTVMIKYGNNYRRALSDLFPNIGLDWSIGDFYGHVPKNHWMDPVNQRNFFDQYAATHGFDPLLPQNWNAKNIATIWTYKGARRIVQLNSNINRALLRAYPNIGLEKFRASV